ncbi:hypothetical protein Q4489_04450 [Thalassotalea sp. 1_MG-2023]|uniref:hypothetical protein n=1 Tax=Thalassotalea sp. 1_MG-2023 TaxID=3062680 RepID=UPI0026E4245E|nr:hypothetical protein [Thalassotalea sp. 1_MG-2023]MDO6426248.1 hypothetical protein [Thalassotalea sp. 1_MG-2023]
MTTTRLTKVLLINNEPVKNIVSDTVQLDLFSPGRAIFTVICEQEPKGLVELQLGYKTSELTPYFLGVIESKHQIKNQWILTCRELIGALSFYVPISIRFATAEQVLANIAELGIEFIIPNEEYMKTPVACFYHSGNGISALKQLGKIYQIENYIFQQQNNGKIYVGSWDHSPWAQETIENFDESVINVKNATNGECVAIPKLRPGIKINNRYITETTLTGNKQGLKWSKVIYDA